jgi:hypothetical protein
VSEVERRKTVSLWIIRLRKLSEEIGCVVQYFEITGKVRGRGCRDEETEKCYDGREHELGVDPVISDE